MHRPHNDAVEIHGIRFKDISVCSGQRTVFIYKQTTDNPSKASGSNASSAPRTLTYIVTDIATWQGDLTFEECFGVRGSDGAGDLEQEELY